MPPHKDTDAQFRYQDVMNEILLHIQSNQLKSGSRLPSERKFAETLNCGRPTINKAIACLIAEGRLRREGYKLYVASPPLSRATKSIIAVLCPHPLHQKQRISHNTIEAAHDACQVAQVRLVPKLSVDAEQQRTQLLELSQEDIDGILIWPHPDSQFSDLLKRFELQKTPIVVNDIPMRGLDCIRADNSSGIRLLLSHLHDRGHREIAYFTKNVANINISERLEAYQQIAYHKFSKDSIHRVYELPGHTSSGLPELFNKFLKNSAEVTAICCSNDVIALDLMTLCQQHKIRIPEDLSIVGFDGIDTFGNNSPALTTVAQDFYQMGTLAVDLLIRRIHMRQFKHAATPLQIHVEPHLLIRESTAAVS